MDKVLIVSPCGLPVPAVKGGAVLTLIESLVIQNKLNKTIDLSIVGTYDADSEKKSKEYSDTQFFFIKKPELIVTLDRLVESILKALHKNKDTPRDFFWKLYVLKYVRKLLLSKKYDKIIFENSGYLLRSLKNGRISQKYKGRFFYHLHNDIPLNIDVDGVKKCKLLIISEYLKININKLCRRDMKNQCVIVRNGFDVNHFTQFLSSDEKDKIKQALNIPKHKKVILFAGRLNANKGIDKLADAFVRLNRDDLTLLIIGSHHFGASDTSKFAENLKHKFGQLGDSVVFTGYVPYTEMWKYYKIADVGVFPSMWEEPAGLTMLEASAAGIPVITTVSGGIPEYLPEEYVYFIKRDDDIVNNLSKAICEVLANYDNWKEKAEKCSKYIINNYSEERYFADFISALKNQ